MSDNRGNPLKLSLNRRGFFASLAGAFLSAKVVPALVSSSSVGAAVPLSLHEQYLSGRMSPAFHPHAFVFTFPPYPCPRFSFAGPLQVTTDPKTGITTSVRLPTPFLPYSTD